MSGVAIALALTAAVLHAAWNRSLKATPDRAAVIVVANVVTALVLLPAVVAAPPREVLALVVLSAVAEVLYALGLAAAYARGELSLTYPIARGVSPLLVTLGGVLLLAERPSRAAVAGAVLLACGLALLAHQGSARDRGPAVALAALTGIAIALYSIVDAHAVRRVWAPSYLGAVHAVAAALLLAILHPGRARLRAALHTGSLIAVGSASGYLLVLVAFTLAPAGVVSTVRETSVPIAVLLCGERPGGRVWAALALAAAGVVLATLGRPG